jgi:hypothetical protein
LQGSDWLTQYWANKYPERIQSGIGAAFYELGVFGFIVPIVFIAGAKRKFGRLGARPAVVFLTVVGLTLLPATPLATPMYGLLVGYLFAPIRPAARETSAFRNHGRDAELLGPIGIEPCHS